MKIDFHSVMAERSVAEACVSLQSGRQKSMGALQSDRRRRVRR
jgi:hypothetical protein